MDRSRFSRREFLKGGIGVLAGATLPAMFQGPGVQAGTFLPSAPSVKEQPNVVVIYSDQLRACSVGCYGNGDISTPHLDQMAAEGVQFTNAVSTSPLCSPARACLQTGRYPTATGVTRNNLKLPDGETGIAEVFGSSGYQTGYVGKWHLGNPDICDPCVDPGWIPPDERQGYRFWLAFEFGHIYYGGRYYLNQNPVMKTIPEGVYEPDFQTDQALRYINQCSLRDRPFFLMLALGTPHGTNCATEYLPPGGDYVFPYDPGSLTLRPNADYPDEQWVRQTYADYYGATSNLDWNVGRILQRLGDLGLADNTVVAFSSDHGDLLGSHYGETGHSSGKKVIFAESLEVPCLIRYPSAVGPSTVEQVFNTVDLGPTLLGLCGLPVPDGVMGRDFSPVLTGEGPAMEPPHGPVPNAECALVGMFDGDWVGVRGAGYTLECASETLQPTRLFDNVQDPYQLSNLVDDPMYAFVRDTLQDDVIRWMDYVTC